MANLSWKNLYIEFGRRLLVYKNDRKTLISKIKNVFATINMKLEYNNDVKDIDPFTIFALFNKKIKEENIPISGLITISSASDGQSMSIDDFDDIKKN